MTLDETELNNYLTASNNQINILQSENANIRSAINSETDNANDAASLRVVAAAKLRAKTAAQSIVDL